MAYNISIRLDNIPYKQLWNIIIWCHRNMCLDKDWAVSEEYIELNGIEASVPKYLWLNSESDLVAMTLALGLKFNVCK
jgi:hypothetical protein